MSLPRRVVPNTTYLVTRRCMGRRFLLRPDAALNQLFLYCLALGAQKYGIAVHGVSVMSNHYHFANSIHPGKVRARAHPTSVRYAPCNARSGCGS